MDELRKFKYVFPDLRVGEELSALLDDVEVEKAILNKKQSVLRVFITSRNWISKQYIFETEDAIARQILNDCTLKVRIRERFLLPPGYTPQNFYELYRPSILLELAARSPLLHQIMVHTELGFPSEDEIEVHMPDTLISGDRGRELLDVLTAVFCERAGFQVRIRSAFDVMTGKEQVADAEDVIASEVSEVVRRNALRRKQAKEEIRIKAEPERRFFRRAAFEADSPDVIYGKRFDGEPVAMAELRDEPGEIVVRGEVFQTAEFQTRNGSTVFTVSLTDYTDSVRMKLFAPEGSEDQFRSVFKTGECFTVRGMMNYDSYEHEVLIRNVYGIRRSAPLRAARHDDMPEKRVELHCHTWMSELDAVTSAKNLIKRAYEWGHKAIAITDHGVVQAFPEAKKTFGDKGGIPADADLKVIYGMEAYLVDDVRPVVQGATVERLRDPAVVVQIQTTGRSPVTHRIIEIAAQRIENGVVTESFSTFVDPKMPIPFSISKVTGITDEMVAGAPSYDRAIYQLLSFCEGAYLASYDAPYEMSFLEQACSRLGITPPQVYVDIPVLAKLFVRDLRTVRFDTLAKAMQVSCPDHLRASSRAEVMAQVYLKLLPILRREGIEMLRDINLHATSSRQHILQSPYYHAILLAKNETGRLNLYRLVSASHLEFFRKRPRIPRSLLQKYREGLILGSACSAGELYQAILRDASDAEIAQIVDFYDYLEIQPVGNNGYLVRSHASGIGSEEDLRDINRRIVKLGEQFKKPVAATCDVHFMDPDDAVYRRIIQCAHGYPDEEQPPLFLHTTREMLDEFAYLGEETARKVVIETPNAIADMCERISPINKDKCPPVIENSDKDLQEICRKRALEMYGDPLPEIVSSRLERELTSIVSNGYAVMYIIARDLVRKSEEDGYMVGSRGSVGSSLVATMAGITEVNPLPPHYYCPACHYSDFDSPEVREYLGRSGADMPDRVCPVCGKPLRKDGFDIPFETFLGFKGDKEPDIDLNFSGDEQAAAQAYTEVIFGKGQTFKAGTITTVADRTAFGMAKGYFDDRGEIKRRCEIERLAAGCTGIRRSSGQHPGGVIVLPKGREINEFTPVQHPANDENSDIITTHFDYHSIEKNLLKLDILGHDNPTMIRKLQDLTGIDPRTVPLDDPGVMSLFSSLDALGIKPEEIGGVQVGVLGIPEFGTSFVIGMLMETKPSTMSELVRISGLSHGTNVWLNNAQEFIRSGDATLSTAICTRDDIMLHLIRCGLEPEMSFKIMESVRKGKGLTPPMEEAMREKKVPDWYIESCRRIRYMFPKAHAAAYVMDALRIAYFKVHYPLAYYAAYFTVRAGGFSYEKICPGRDVLQKSIDALEGKESRTATEDDMLRDMYIAREMYARGFRFEKMDVYRSAAKDFRIVGDALLPSLSSIDGLGDAAAESIEKAAAKGRFLSKDDFRTRAHVSKTITDTLSQLGVLGAIPESNQMSLFDAGLVF